MGRKDIRSKYLRQYASVEPLPSTLRTLSIVIPAYAEHRDLPGNLDSLEEVEGAEAMRVIVVVNNGVEAPDEARASNDAVWDFLQARRGRQRYELEAIDCRGRGVFESSPKVGVGLARKVGMDSALASFEGDPRDCVLVCLDADCQVSPNYALELLNWTRERRGEGTVNIPYEHRLPEDAQFRRAIVTYELFLRYYVGGLKAYGNPYAHHSMGSAFATRGETYCAVRGMVRRRAAEDFYFLDKVCKVAPIGTLFEARVYPSSRISERVVFGTGRTMMKADQGDPLQYFYDLRTFSLLARLRDILGRGGDAEELERCSAETGWDWSEYFQTRRWPAARERLFVKTKEGWERRGRFDDWFDGLESLKLAHTIRDELYPRCFALEVMEPFSRLLGDERQALSLEEWLDWARVRVP